MLKDQPSQKKSQYSVLNTNMKKLILANPSYRFLEQSFAEWLDIQGFAEITVYNLPTHVREFLFYLENQKINHIKNLQTKHIYNYYEKLKERTHQSKGGGLSGAHLNKHIQALKKFTEYLRKVGRIELPVLNLGNEDSNHRIIFLTEEEIQLLFKASYQTHSQNQNLTPEIVAVMQARDRAMLAIFYGCGLRRNEGVHLNLPDIHFDKSIGRESGILHVRKGKNNQERFVPINTACLKYLQEYIYDYRPSFSKSGTVDALFLGQWGTRMKGQSLLRRLKLLQHRTENNELLEKDVGLHTLRHSIATHLMDAGMSIESISRFLGHSSLESTQIYTHLKQEQPFNNIPTYETHKLHEDE